MLLLETRDDHASISGALCFDEKRVLRGMERKGALYNIGMPSHVFLLSWGRKSFWRIV